MLWAIHPNKFDSTSTSKGPRRQATHAKRSACRIECGSHTTSSDVESSSLAPLRKFRRHVKGLKARR